MLDKLEFCHYNKERKLQFFRIEEIKREKSNFNFKYIKLN